MKKILGYLQKIENGILIASFTSMVVFSFAQVVNRNLIKAPIAWFEEVALYSMIYMVLLGTEAGLRDGTQIRVTALVDRLHGRCRRVVDILAKLVVMVFSADVLYNAVHMIGKQIETQQLSPVLRIPMAIPYMARAVSFGVSTVVHLADVVLMTVDVFTEER